MYSYQDEIVQRQHQSSSSSSSPQPQPQSQPSSTLQNQTMELSIEETIHLKNIGLQSTKQKLLKAIVDSYNLDHKIKSKSGELQKKRMTNNQIRAHEHHIFNARTMRMQKERLIQKYISRIKVIDKEIKKLQKI
jgi:hypothetical protein